MGEPAAVQRATDGYQADSDPVLRFTQDYCVTGPNCSALARDLFTAWARWAERDGSERMSEKTFGAELDRLGFEGRKTNVGKVRAGIGLPAERMDERGGDGW